MALINCPDCGKEISDKSTLCINCGFPINDESKKKNTKCLINGREYDLSFVFKCETKPEAIGIFMKLVNCGLIDAKKTIDSILESKEIPKILSIEQIQNPNEQNFAKCPSCNSTNISKISATGRVISTGIFGLASSKIGKTHKCNNCGSTW